MPTTWNIAAQVVPNAGIGGSGSLPPSTQLLLDVMLGLGRVHQRMIFGTAVTVLGLINLARLQITDLPAKSLTMVAQVLSNPPGFDDQWTVSVWCAPVVPWAGIEVSVVPAQRAHGHELADAAQQTMAQRRFFGR